MATELKDLYKLNEHQEQASFFDWLHFAYLHMFPEIHPLFFAVPNGFALVGGGNDKRAQARKFAYINKMKKEGMTPGVADTLFLSGHGGYFGLALEFKTRDKKNEKGGGLTEGQQEFLTAARLEGYRAVTAYGADEAQAIVEEYLSYPKTQDMIYRALKNLEEGHPEAAKLILKEVVLAW
jgi:hypothetical protein